MIKYTLEQDIKILKSKVEFMQRVLTEIQAGLTNIELDVQKEKETKHD